MKRYRVIHPIQHNGRTYKKGEELILDGESAKNAFQSLEEIKITIIESDLDEIENQENESSLDNQDEEDIQDSQDDEEVLDIQEQEDIQEVKKTPRKKSNKKKVENE